MRASPPLFGVIAALVIAVAFYFLLYKPASEEQARVEAETATLENQQRTLEQQIAQLRDIEARQVEINAAKARLLEYIPNGPAQPSVIRHFQSTADASGAEIASVTFGEPTVPDPAAGAVPADTGTPGTTLANIPVTMTLEGGYFQTVDFFRRMEVDVPRAVLVQTIDVGEEEDAGYPTLSTTWTGQVFAVISSGDLVDTQGAAGGTGAPGGTGAAPTPAPTPTEAGGE